MCSFMQFVFRLTSSDRKQQRRTPSSGRTRNKTWCACYVAGEDRGVERCRYFDPGLTCVSGFDPSAIRRSSTPYLEATVTRLNTNGGSAPASGCSAPTDAGQQTLVPYSADYYFLSGGSMIISFVVAKRSGRRKTLRERVSVVVCS